MIQLEIKNTDSVVRIHDDYCQQATARQIANISQIVSDAYKRRQAEVEQTTVVPETPTAS